MAETQDIRRILETLPQSEWETLRYRADGLSYQAVALKLFVAKSTVEEYLHRAYDKLGLEPVDDKAERLRFLKTHVYPIVKAQNVWPGRNLPVKSSPRAIINLKILSDVINDEDDDFVDDSTKWLEPPVIGGLVKRGDRIVIEGEVVQPEQLPPGSRGRQALPAGELSGRQGQQLVPVGEPAGRPAKLLGLGSLLGVLVGVGAATYGLSSGWLKPYLPVSPPQVIEVTREIPFPQPFTITQVFVTPGQIVQITTTPGPTDTPSPSQTPLPTAVPLPIPAPVTVTVPVPMTITVVVAATPNSQNVKLQSPSVIGPALNAERIGDSQSGFNSPWRWQVGASPDNSYRFDDDPTAVTLIAGRQTNFYANVFTGPSIARPISDTIDIRARIDFDPKERHQVAGLGIHSAKDPSMWVAIRRFSNGEGQWIEAVVARGGEWTQLVFLPYASRTTYLRLIREKEFVTFAFSDNGRNWVTLKRNYLWQLTGSTEAQLHLYSSSGKDGIVGRFSDVSLATPDQNRDLDDEPTGTIAFAETDTPDKLAPAWGYSQGGNPGSSYRITNGNLVLIAAGHTDGLDGNRLSPFVVIPASGDFATQVKVEIDPHERHQIAGLALWSGEEAAYLVGLRRYSNGEGQFVDAIQGGSIGNRPIGNPQYQNYSDKSVYFRIERSDTLLSLAYSADGKTWTELAHEFVLKFNDPLKIVLYVWSSSANGIPATFSEFSVTPK